jgi:hypothetical protein
VAGALEATEHGAIGAALGRGIDALQEAANWIRGNNDVAGSNAGAAAYHFLMLAGTVTGGWQLGIAALAAARRLAAGEGNADFLRAKLVTARFYAQQIMPRAGMHAAAVVAGGEAVMALDEAMF